MTIKCPLCTNSGQVVCVDRLGHATGNRVAGVPLSEGFPTTFQLMECRSCGLRFKDPLPSFDQLKMFYSQSPDDNWGFQPDPEVRRFNELESIARRLSGGGRRVLDIGCSNGALLASWPSDWSKFGIEPSKAARAVAEGRGIRIIGDDVGSVAADCGKFDVVICVDVIEHLPDPSTFFDVLKTLIHTETILIFVTGNASFWWWKTVSKGSYWYSALPEHLCFYSKEAFRSLEGLKSLSLVELKRITHQKTDDPSQYLLQLSKNIVFFLIKNVPFIGRSPRLMRGYPVFLTARDHLIAVLKPVR